MEAEPEVVTLIGEDGLEKGYRLHDVFDLEGIAYYLVESVDEPDQVLLLREGEDGLETVEAEEFDRVIAALEAEPE